MLLDLQKHTRTSREDVAQWLSPSNVNIMKGEVGHTSSVRRGIYRTLLTPSSTLKDCVAERVKLFTIFEVC
jgi:hypothetical protein